MASGTGINVTGGFSYLLSKDYEKVTMDAYMRYQPMWKTLAKLQVTKGLQTYKEGDMTGLKLLNEKNEGAAIQYESFLQGGTKSVTFTNFALGVPVTEEMFDYDLKGHMQPKKMFEELGKAAAYTEEYEFFDLLNTGFVNTYRTGLDGLALFHDTHTITDASTTYDNNSTSALAQSSLETALTYFRKVKNNRGVPIQMTPSILVIPPELEWTAKKLLLSELDPETANNNINAFKDVGLRYVVCPYLSSTTAWFVLAKEHDLRFIRSKEMKFQSTDDFNTSSALFKVSTRFTTDFWDPRGVYGSSGA